MALRWRKMPQSALEVWGAARGFDHAPSHVDLDDAEKGRVLAQVEPRPLPIKGEACSVCGKRGDAVLWAGVIGCPRCRSDLS